MWLKLSSRIRGLKLWYLLMTAPEFMVSACGLWGFQSFSYVFSLILGLPGRERNIYLQSDEEDERDNLT